MFDEAVAELHQAREQLKIAQANEQSTYRTYCQAKKYLDKCEERLNSARAKLLGIIERVEFRAETLRIHEREAIHEKATQEQSVEA